MPTRIPVKGGLAHYATAATIGVVGVACFAPFGLFWLAPLVWFGLFQLLRQAATTLPEILGRELQPLTFVNSLRLGEPPSNPRPRCQRPDCGCRCPG